MANSIVFKINCYAVTRRHVEEITMLIDRMRTYYDGKKGGDYQVTIQNDRDEVGYVASGIRIMPMDWRVDFSQPDGFTTEDNSGSNQ